MGNPTTIDSARAYHQRGLAHARERQLDQAIQAFAHAIQVNPRLAVAYIDRGIAYAQRGDFRRALADLSKGLALSPNHPAALLARSLVHFELRAFDAALSDLNAARLAAPHDADICYQRGRLQLARQDHAAALADFLDAVTLNPKNARFCNQVAWLCSTHRDVHLRDGAKAVEYASKACELTQWQDPVVLDTLAAAYAECGQFAEATRWLENALILATPTEAQPLRNRLALYQAGQPYREISG